MFSVGIKRKEFMALVIGLVLVFGVYYEFVQLVNNVVWHDFVDSVSLSSKHGSVDGFRFAMGEDVVVTAKVRDSNSYLLNVYDDNGSVVFSAGGAVLGSYVRVSVPLSSPAFAAQRVYSVVFQSGLVNYPVPGVHVYGSSVSGFGVVGSLAVVNVTASYDEAMSELSVASFLLTSNLSPVVNRTVGFYLKPNSDLPMADRGWVHLGSRDTDENGSVSFSVAVSIAGGVHELEARFAGDDDFGSCRNRTSFRTPFKRAYVRIVNAEKQRDKISLVLRIVDKYGFPLAGKLFNFEALNIQKSVLHLISDANGYVPVSLEVDRSLSFVDSRMTVLGDAYTSECRVATRLNLAGSKVSYETNYDENVLAVSDETTGSHSLDRPLKTESSFQTLEGGSEGIGLEVNPNPGRADLHQRVEASILTLRRDYGSVKFYYYLNGTTLEGSVTASCNVIRQYDEEQGWIFIYWYFGTLLWYPDYFGDFYFLVVARDSHNNTIGEGTVSFTVQPAPANIVVYYPESFVDEPLNLVVAFSMSRTYEAPADNGFFQSSRLAPTLVWDSVKYMLDLGTNSTVIHVYVNGSKLTDVTPDIDGICGALIPVSFSANHSSLNIRVVTNATSRYREVAVEQNLTLTKVNVKNNMSAVNSDFKFSSTLGSLDSGDITYVSLNNTLEASASLFNLTLYNVTSSFVVSRMVGRTSTNGSAFVSVPAGTDFVRVKYPCSLAQSMLAPLTDLNRDRNTTNGDYSLVQYRYGSALGDLSYDYYYDLNLDFQINSTDGDIVKRERWNQTVYFDCSFNMNNIMLYFDIGQNVNLTSMGFGSIPSGATQLNMSVGGVIEFFDISLVQGDSTNNLGVASVDWRPPEIGVYLLNASLPSNFDAVVTLNTNVTQVSAPLTTASYYYIAKTPVNLAVDMSGDFNITTLEPVADAYVSEEHPGQNYGSATGMNVGPVGSLEYRSFMRFNTTSIPADAYILSARLDLFFWINSSFVEPREFGVYQVSEQWNEPSINWSSQPRFSELYPPPSTFQMFGAGQNGSVFLDVTDNVRMWQSSPGSNFGFVLKEVLLSDDYLAYLHSREASDYRPVLGVSYFLPSPTLVATAIDNATQQVISSLQVQFSENGASLGSATTNSSGVATLAWSPTSNVAYNISVSSAENVTYKPNWFDSVFDFRFSTNMTSLDGNPINVTIGPSYDYHFRLVSSSSFGLKDKTARFFVNGTSVDGGQYSGGGTDITDTGGNVKFAWEVEHGGVYSLRALFDGDENYGACETYVTINASVTPFGIQFEVTPAEFEPGASVLLNATIMDPFTGKRVTGGVRMNVTFFRLGSDGSNVTIARNMSSTGEATNRTTYPNNNVTYAYVARLDSVSQDGVVPQGVVSNPVQLTVSNSTTLLLDVTNDDYSDVRYTISGCLKHNGLPVVHRLVRIRINDTQWISPKTNEYGTFSTFYNFWPVNNTLTTYIVTATFEGDTGTNVTAWANTPEGTPYPASTTMQFPYKPSSNTTILKVDPRAAQLMRLAKSPEEMQKDAQSLGLRTWGPDSWSIFPPFFKLHARASVSSLSLENELWAGLFGCGVDSARGLSSLLQTAFTGLDNTMRDIAMSAVVAILTSALTLLSLNAVAAYIGFFTILGYLLAFISYTLGIAVTIALTYFIPDAGLSRAILYGIGFALFGMILVAFWNDPQARTFPAVLKQQLTGEDPATSAAKSISATFLTAIATVNLMAASWMFMNPWMWPFAVSTFVLGLWAIKLAGER